jgi:hypothetical protein
MMPTRPLLLVAAAFLSVLPAPAQAAPPAAPAVADPAAVGAALQAWAAGYAQNRLGPYAELRHDSLTAVPYLRHASAAGLAGPADVGRLNHLDVLQRLLHRAQKQPDEAAVAGLLAIAACGLDGAFLEPTSAMLRELGHGAVLGIDAVAPWVTVVRVAAGEPGAVRADLAAPLVRVAALRLLGSKGEAAFVPTVAQALRDGEPRVRIAAAEAAATLRSPDLLEPILTALYGESHPVASQALAQALLAVGAAREVGADLALRERIVRAALGRFGRYGWRTDLDLLDLVERFPHQVAVPMLIEALAAANTPPDRLTKVLNANASPRRKQRVAELLRRTTGALVAPEDVGGWRRFWQEAGPTLVVPETLVRDEVGATRAEFFGVPVTGGAVGFLIDTSGSMENLHRASSTRRGGSQTRLDVAKVQLGYAVQAMDDGATFSVFSFAETAHEWTRAPVPAGRGAARALTELTGKLRAEGGTDLFAGLAAALRLQQARFGEAAPTRIDELFVLSDGLPSTGVVRDRDRMLELVREANRTARIRIHTIHIGEGDGAQFLRRLADENAGVFVQR